MGGREGGREEGKWKKGEGGLRGGGMGGGEERKGGEGESNRCSVPGDSPWDPPTPTVGMLQF